jgi:CDP-glycerol glycerophosphotransferase (TagB/SpsB family)
MFCLSGGAKLVNLWHGLPMKRIEFDITSGPLADRFVKRSLKERFYHPENFQRPDYLLTASPFFSETFARSFRISVEQCLLMGYPRNVILNCSEAERMRFVEKYEPDTTKMLITRLKEGSYNRVFIYLPTWRDSQRDFFSHDFDLKALDETLRQCNALLLLKPHANVAVEASVVEGLTNVEFVPSSVDIYPVLPYTDVLITDYSSVLYDYVLMEQKGMILYLYDFQEYEKERNFTRAFDDLAFGKRVFDFASLLTTIREGDYMMEEDERKTFACKCWGFDSEKASERIGLFFQQS